MFPDSYYDGMDISPEKMSSLVFSPRGQYAICKALVIATRCGKPLDPVMAEDIEFLLNRVFAHFRDVCVLEYEEADDS